jgi:hypothetical protein
MRYSSYIFLCFGIGFVLAEESTATLSAEEYVIYCVIALGCVLFAGAMSGLTVGLMSLDDLVLEMKLASGNAEEKA